MKILIVEDEQDLARMYSETLTLLGHSIAGVAADGSEAVSLFHSRSDIDLIIMDHRMPVKTGLEAAREILAEKHSARIIMASADPNIESEAAAAGIMLFLKKPFDFERLVETIERMGR